MTHEELQTAKKAGQVRYDAPSPEPENSPQNDGDVSAPDFDPEAGYTLEDFLPLLVTLLPLVHHSATPPTYVPKNFLECFAFYDTGAVRRLYLYINKTWRYCTLT